MQKVKKYFFSVIIIVAIGALAFLFYGHKTLAPKSTPAVQNIPNTNISAQAAAFPKTSPAKPAAPEYALVGPRGNVPNSAPKDYGFWSFAIPVPGVLSRSGQPTLTDFKWLKVNGWVSDIDLRIDGDHDEVSDDAKISGFNELGFNYLKIQMVDGAAPTDAQADQFLVFVTKPENQPAEVHCRGGIGRAGIMVALYRYAVQGWSIDKIMAESKLYQGGIDQGQQNWLANYAKAHAPGSYGKD